MAPGKVSRQLGSQERGTGPRYPNLSPRKLEALSPLKVT